MALNIIKDFKNIAVFVAFPFLLAANAAAQEAAPLANHLAVYDLLLDNTSAKSGISGLRGRMVYEFRGNRCEGYTTQARFVSRVDGEDKQTMLSDKQITSFESANGREFRFVVQNYTNEVLDEEREGSAINDGKSIRVKLKKPKEENVTLKKAQFPTFEAMDVIRYALAGKTFYRSTVYDGTDESNKLSYTSTFIGKEKIETAAKTDKLLGVFSGMRYWPVTVTYFDDQENPDGLPIYRTSFLLYQNGVTRDLLMDYGTFSIRAKLNELIIYDTPDDKSCAVKGRSTPAK